MDLKLWNFESRRTYLTRFANYNFLLILRSATQTAGSITLWFLFFHFFCLSAAGYLREARLEGCGFCSHLYFPQPPKKKLWNGALITTLIGIIGQYECEHRILFYFLVCPLIFIIWEFFFSGAMDVPLPLEKLSLESKTQ